MSTSTILIEISNSISARSQDLSLIFTFFTTGVIIGQLTSVFYNIKFTKMRIMLPAYFLLIPVTILLSFANSLLIFFISYFIVGYLLGIIWVQANENILESKIKNKDKLMTVSLSFYPLGAFTGPFIATSIIINKLSWRFLYYILTVLIVIIALLYFFIMRKRKDKILVEKREKIDFNKIFYDKDKNITFAIIAFGLLAYSISDTSLIVWSPTFFRVVRMIDIKTAGYLISIFWIAIIAGRIILMPFLGKIRTSRILLVLSFIAISFTAFTIFSPVKFWIFTGMILTGMGFSAIYPLLISSGSIVYEKGRGVLISILFVSAYIGKSVAPFLTRYISKYSMFFSLSISIIFMGITIIFILLDIFYKKRHLGIR